MNNNILPQAFKWVLCGWEHRGDDEVVLAKEVLKSQHELADMMDLVKVTGVVLNNNFENSRLCNILELSLEYFI